MLYPCECWAYGWCAVGAIDDLEAEFFHHEVVIHHGASASPYGMSVGEPVPAKGFVQQKTLHVTGTTGDELVNDTTVYLPLRVVVEVGDTITLPAPFTGTWEVFDRTAHDGAGRDMPNHQKLTLVAAQAPNPGGVYG